MSADSTVSVIRATLTDLGLSPECGSVLVAVSGGPDSVCLLHALRELEYTVEVAHFDHQTRDGLSAEDAAFVKALAQDLNLTCHEERKPIETLAAKSPRSFEEVAREARYTFFEQTAAEAGCAFIATGHHAGDQAETVLMRVLRGTTPRGLAGIPARAKRGDVTVIRPLIRLPQVAIDAYLNERGHRFCEDTSNKDVRFVRNRVRHELLPLLQRDYNPKVADALCRLAETQRAESELVSSMTAMFLNDCLNKDGAINRDAFSAGHPALQRRAVLEFAWCHGVECTFDRVEEAVGLICGGPTGKRCDLGGGVLLCNGRDTTVAAFTDAESPNTLEVVLAVPGRTAAFGKCVVVRELDDPPAETLRTYCSPTRQVFDADQLDGEIALRHGRDGDRFSPYGLGGTKKLKDYLSELGIPETRRDEQLLVTAGKEIVWVLGHAIGARAAVSGTSQRLVEFVVADEA